jgi:hypothetical protein
MRVALAEVAIDPDLAINDADLEHQIALFEAERNDAVLDAQGEAFEAAQVEERLAWQIERQDAAWVEWELWRPEAEAHGRPHVIARRLAPQEAKQDRSSDAWPKTRIAVDWYPGNDNRRRYLEERRQARQRIPCAAPRVFDRRCGWCRASHSYGMPCQRWSECKHCHPLACEAYVALYEQIAATLGGCSARLLLVRPAKTESDSRRRVARLVRARADRGRPAGAGLVGRAFDGDGGLVMKVLVWWPMGCDPMERHPEIGEVLSQRTIDREAVADTIREIVPLYSPTAPYGIRGLARSALAPLGAFRGLGGYRQGVRLLGRPTAPLRCRSCRRTFGGH